MGVQIYLLDRRKVTLLVGDQPVDAGTLRRSWKVTEFDGERLAEIETAKADLQGQVAPMAAIIADVTELALDANFREAIAGHLVLGWDADRSSVTDFSWDYLPVLGYAVQIGTSGKYVLHEERAGRLSPITAARAVELGIHDHGGHFLRRGQPAITECRAVRPYIVGYAQADCVLSDGRNADILTSVESESLPNPAWYIGKRPSDVVLYSETRAVE